MSFNQKHFQFKGLLQKQYHLGAISLIHNFTSWKECDWHSTNKCYGLKLNSSFDFIAITIIIKKK